MVLTPLTRPVRRLPPPSATPTHSHTHRPMTDSEGRTTAADTEGRRRRRENHWRTAGWSAAALVLLVPLVATQLTDEVAWSGADFVLAGTLLLSVGVLLELAALKTGDPAYRSAVGVALSAALLLVWLSLGVGIIGADGDPANVLYGGVLAVGAVGALVARFRPHGMARAMAATALAQAAVAAGALVAGLGQPWSGPLELVGLNGVFAALWVGSAVLFQQAARGRPPTGAGPEG